MRLQREKRPGATLVESAVVSPVVFLLILGLLVGASGVFRYQEIASLARRAARYASVHGTQYAKDTGNPAATPTVSGPALPGSDIYNNVAANAVILDLSRLTCSVNYNSANSPYSTSNVNGQVVATANTVSVTVSYQWIPEVFLGGITLTSTSVMPMCY
jgi:Flp pilus assembly protein TadG